MSSALIGDTGYVGGHIKKHFQFDHLYNSRNFSEIEGVAHDLVVCAGIQSKKWWANENPADDWTAIKTFISDFSRYCRFEHLVLISTIDIYDDKASGKSERDLPNIIHQDPYGYHRYMAEEAFERIAEQLGKKITIVRLPGLFSGDLRKNVIFDLINNNECHKINPAHKFQWYDMERIGSDLETIISLRESGGLPRIVNLFPEPVELRAIIDRWFPHIKTGPYDEAAAVSYDLHTSLASHFGGEGRYIESKQDVMDRFYRLFASSDQSSDQ